MKYGDFWGLIVSFCVIICLCCKICLGKSVLSLEWNSNNKQTFFGIFGDFGILFWLIQLKNKNLLNHYLKNYRNKYKIL
jgi:hypothetical protein